MKSNDIKTEYWCKKGYDESDNETYFEDSDGYWSKKEYNKNGNETYFENSDGVQRGAPPPSTCNGKVIPAMAKLFLKWQSSYHCK